jgi:large subunit ribosomal protein L5
MTPRLKERYLDEVKPELIKRFGYKSSMQAPGLEKITLNMGVGDAKLDSKLLDAAAEQLATITGQKPAVRRARKSIANFKLREGMAVGVKVTLRADRMWEMLDRLESIAIPRIRDFRGLNPRSFDGRGNYSMGIREQIIFPEVDYDAIDQVRGLDVTITTTAPTDEEAFELLRLLGLPFRRDDADQPARATGATAPAAPPADQNGSAADQEPAAEEPDAEEPAAEEPATEEPATEEPAAEEPAAEEPAAEEPVAEEAATEEPSAEEPAAEETAAEEPDQPEAEEAGEPDTET